MLSSVYKVPCELEERWFDERPQGTTNHVFIRLADGRILDATADQFGLAPIYLGHMPAQYLAWIQCTDMIFRGDTSMLTLEDRQAAELAELRKPCDEYAEANRALEERLVTGEQEDVAAFGRAAWIYCRQHMKAHQTGWCSVSARDKIGLGVATAQEATEKCREWGLELYHDSSPNG